MGNRHQFGPGSQGSGWGSLLRAGLAFAALLSLAFAPLAPQTPPTPNPNTPATPTAPPRTPAPSPVPASAPGPGTPAAPAGAFQVIPAARMASHVAVIPVRGRIDQFMTVSVERRLARAKAIGADAAVLEFESQSSDYGTFIELLKVVRSSPIPNTVAWVRSRATGGAGLLALACPDIITTDTGVIGGFVEPEWLDLSINLRGRRGRQQATATNAAELAGPALAGAIESARRTGRDEFLVQALAVPGVELWLIQNPSTGERRCVNEEEFRQVFGKTPARGSAELSPGRDLPALRGFSAAAAAGLPPISPGPSPGGPSAAGPGVLPASPMADALLAIPGAADLIDTPTRRQALTAADQPRWSLVTYAADPSAAATLHGDQAVKYGLASAVVGTEAELTAYFGARRVERLEESWAEVGARFLASPYLRGVLISIFLISMFVELTHPGMVVPGLVAALMLFLILAPSFLVGIAGWWSLGAIAVGVLLLALELFVIPGFGVAGVLGLVILFVGLVFTFLPSGPAGIAFSSAEAQTALVRGVVTVLLSSVTAFFGLFFVIRHLGTLPILRRYTLQNPAPGEVDESIFGALRRDENATVAVGEVGTAATPLRPAGKAKFGEDYLDVVAEGGYVAEGTPVRVIEADRFRVVVEAERPARPSAPPA